MELPTWYVMESKGGEDWLRPSHPLTEERDIGEQEDVHYAVATLWNLLDCRDEEGVPLMTVVEWLRFIQARSQVDAGSYDQSPPPSAMDGQSIAGDVLGLEDGVRSSSWHRTATGGRHQKS